jgi:thioredoxin-like negative regulator of GroEL
MTETIVYAFTAATCTRCRLFLPTFEEWAQKYCPKADFVVVHLDKATPEMLEQFGVTAVPTIVVLRGDKVVAKLVGAPPEQEIARLLEASDNAGDGDTTAAPTGEEGG